MKDTAVLPSGFTVTGHSGCEGTKENSLECIKKAFESGADISEIDLNFDGGTPVLSHNAPAGGEVTLDEAFALLAKCGEMKMNIDVKNTANMGEVIRLAGEHGVTEKIFFTGVVESFVPDVRDLGIPYYLNTDVFAPRTHCRNYINSLIEKVKNAGAIGINMHYPGLGKRLSKAFHDEGLLVSVWTVNKKGAMKKVLAARPDNITTRKPLMLLDVIKSESQTVNLTK